MIHFKIKILLFFLIIAILTIPLFSKGLKLKAVRTEKAPGIDGKLTDECWDLAKPFSHFLQVDPKTGEEPTEKTELKILYTQSALYLGIKCFSKEPEKISVKSLKRDKFGWRSRGDDIVKILIDPFQDKRNAYVFVVNPKGAKTDGLAFGEHFSPNWDGIWDAECRIDKDGWSAEIKIPFKTISFNSALTEWGLNVERYIARKIETDRMEGISKDIFFFNPNEAALITGIKNIKQGLGLTFKPYAIISTSKDFENSLKRDWDIEGGFDLYKNFTPNLVGVFTYNTDFAETEVDDRKINLTRFSLFYPEKRSFFLEGSEIFSFGSGLWRVFIPFFSRTIGIYDDEEQVPINWGMKVYGKIGKTNIGLLNVRTKETEFIGGKNFFAGRISQNILEQSKIGIIFTNGNPDEDAKNSLIGLDFKYSTSKFLKRKNFSASAWWAYNENTIEEGSHSGYGINIDYPNDLWDVNLSYNYFGDAMEPGLAFLPRNGVKIFRNNISFKPRPSGGMLGNLVRQFYFELRSYVYLDLNNNLQSSQIFTAPLNFRTESGDHIEFNIIPKKEVLDEAFDLSDDIIFTPGSYTFTQYRFQIDTASHRPVGFNFQIKFGDFYSGKLSEVHIGTSFKHNGNISVGLGAILVKGNFPQGKYRTNLYRLKADFFMKPETGLMTFIQYDDESRELGANIRFKWRISPGNVIYLVYNKNWLKSWDPESRFYPLQDIGVFKIQLSVRP